MTKDSPVIFAPHPDDETLGCGGTIAKKITEGSEVSVVVLTDGRYALKSLGIETNPTPEELKEIRRGEVRKALRVLGVKEENTFLLDFEDRSLRNYQKSAEEKVLAILEKNPPSEVYLTSAKDYSLDHRVTNNIVRNVLLRLGLDVVVYQYSILKRFAGIESILDPIVSLFKQNIVCVDISEYLQLKKAALYEYKSQTTIVSIKQSKTVLTSSVVSAHLKKWEVFLRI